MSSEIEQYIENNKDILSKYSITFNLIGSGKMTNKEVYERLRQLASNFKDEDENENDFNILKPTEYFN